MRQIVMRKSFASVANDEKKMRQARGDLVDVGTGMRRICA